LGVGDNRSIALLVATSPEPPAASMSDVVTMVLETTE
jgi:hypothetical protein